MDCIPAVSVEVGVALKNTVDVAAEVSGWEMQVSDFVFEAAFVVGGADVVALFSLCLVSAN